MFAADNMADCAPLVPRALSSARYKADSCLCIAEQSRGRWANGEGEMDDLEARVGALEVASERQREQLTELRILVRVLGRALATSIAGYVSSEAFERAWELMGALDSDFWTEEDKVSSDDRAARRLLDRVNEEIQAIGQHAIRFARPLNERGP